MEDEEKGEKRLEYREKNWMGGKYTATSGRRRRGRERRRESGNECVEESRRRSNGETPKSTTKCFGIRVIDNHCG